VAELLAGGFELMEHIGHIIAVLLNILNVIIDAFVGTTFAYGALTLFL
jgi:hypothetical protein